MKHLEGNKAMKTLLVYFKNIRHLLSFMLVRWTSKVCGGPFRSSIENSVLSQMSTVFYN